jgi:LPXTG-site transpeptidase (sortase) family protein
MGLTDNLPGILPAGVAIAPAPAPAPVNDCGGTLTAVLGTQDIQLINGTLNANSSCTIVVPVTGTVPGDYENVIPVDALTNNENVTNTQQARDTLTVTGSSTPGGGGTSGGGGGGRSLVGLIPVTGFAPGRVTDLSGLPVTSYHALNDVTLEVPTLKLKLPIVGVPMKNKTWDVNWLLNQAGWLEGSAFPGFSGNSVLTSHVTLPYGEAGPFSTLHKLKTGDKVFLHSFGDLYIYEVKSIRELYATDPAILQHEEKSWLTLVTCADYNEKAETYLKRLAVKAELVETRPDLWSSNWP